MSPPGRRLRRSFREQQQPQVPNSKELPNRECSQVRMVDAISQPGCAECGAGGLVLTDY